MEITEQLVRDVAELAQLEVGDQDMEPLKAGMTRILALAEALQSVDTTDVAPLANPLELEQQPAAPLTQDAVTEGNQRDRFQAMAPEAEAGLYLVPRVVE